MKTCDQEMRELTTLCVLQKKTPYQNSFFLKAHGLQPPEYNTFCVSLSYGRHNLICDIGLRYRGLCIKGGGFCLLLADHTLIHVRSNLTIFC